MQSRLEHNGKEFYLVCYYGPETRDFTKVIRDAFRHHHIDDTEAVKMPVLCLPRKEKENADRRI